MRFKYPVIKLEHVSSYALAVHRTAKELISSRGKNKNISSKWQKMKNARAKLFFIVK